MKNITRLTSGVALAALGLGMSAAVAHAADAAPAGDTKDVIVVTGTISKNPAAATASPVVSFSSEDLANRSLNQVADALQNLTANNAGTNPNSWTGFGFATGASAISLRGLNDAYTLTIFNGMRSAPYPLADDGYRNFVDLNSLPAAILDRIDVLEDGASATYGSDAIAGVVNVIPKKVIVGLHADLSGAITQHGDAGERHASVTYGYGDLKSQGFNFYVNGEYQKNDRLMMNQRGAPFNTADQSSICDAAGSCLANGVRNGIQPGGGYNGFQTTIVPFVRPYSQAGGSLGGYQLLNPNAGCQGLTAVTLTDAQRTGPAPAVVCQQDLVKQYRQYSPAMERKGLNFHGTFNIGSAQAYVMANYYDVKTDSITSPSGFTGQTAAGGAQTTVSYIFLPTYVCPTGTSSIGQFGNFANALTASGCTAANGTLNPNNPFAASGNLARLGALASVPRTTTTDATTFRLSGGIDGSFAPGFDYHLAATHSSVALDVTQDGYVYLQGLMDAVATGSYNFVDPQLNSAQVNQQVFPTDRTHSISKLTEIQGTVAKDLFKLPGGALNFAVAGQYRYEAIHAPSDNPPNNAAPNSRYYSINAAGTDGTRTVWSIGYELTAPITDMLKVKAEGNYDHYSAGQKAFSPKFEAEFKPISQIKLRSTFSRGFRAPSFSEAYSLPTTGYVNAAISCNNPTFAAFCAAHQNNPSYYNTGYSYGLTAAGNPALNPEKATSFTLGTVLQPNARTTITVDYWSTKITSVIVPVQATPDMIAQYYANNGVVNVPGVTVTSGVADPNNPGALPLLGTISGSYTNADSFLAKGIDFSIAMRNLPLGKTGVTWTTQANASLLLKLAQVNQDGSVSVYDGTLGPCNITSCSGAPRWRAAWANTFTFGDHYRMTLTANYTSGYSSVATDSGGILGDCQASGDNGQLFEFPDGSPVQCRGKAVFDLDGHFEVKPTNQFRLYLDVKNILNSAPPYEPNAAYGLYQFNPAWADSLFMGRTFRVGVKIDL